MIYEIIYSSVAARPFAAQELEALVSHARHRNAQTCLTGILLHRDAAFLQVLEGDELAVRATFERIRCDARHGSLTVVRSGTKQRRSLSAWPMGFVALGQAVPPVLHGSQSPSSDGTLLVDGDADVIAILDRFRRGP